MLVLTKLNLMKKLLEEICILLQTVGCFVYKLLFMTANVINGILSWQKTGYII